MVKKTQSQIGKMSRRKGKTFERWCARYFTTWTGIKWETTRNSGRTDLKGDIYCMQYPYLSLIVECKHRKTYSVHAMLKPTLAFEKMIDESRSKLLQGQFLIFIVKNDTGVWMSNSLMMHGIKQHSGFRSMDKATGMKCCKGTTWYKIQDYESNHPRDFEGVCFGKNPRF
ncbi:hypothetical protein LCGC14_1582040 [marine sediment metagenome]|uniref:Uncharacterized protein n=1 Tax=marine sediment metagenome TaxID=412755 RepID=A0A0F9KX97_9ZZZZ